ncbi:MAG: hypothetical protein M3O36_09340, partial [Myxococcota bacterium]|nr:hypothetical protein [Myxococcota bacterium]
LAAIHRMAEARQRLADASAIADGDESLVKPVLLAEAELATRQGDFRRALVVLDELHRIAHAMKDDHEKHRVALHLAQSHAAMGDRITALAHHQGAAHLLLDDRTAALERMKVRALIDYFTRDFLAAAQHSEKAIDLGREMGLTYEVMLNLHHLGQTLVQLEDLPRAYGAVGQSLALCEECGDERFANYNRMLLAFLDGLQGTVDGEKLLRQGIAYAEAKGFTSDVIGGRLLLANLLFRVGRSETARAEYRTTRELASGAGHRLIADECQIALSMLDAGENTHRDRRLESASSGE